MDERLSAVGLIPVAQRGRANDCTVGQIEIPWFGQAKAVEVIFECGDSTLLPNELQVHAFCDFANNKTEFFESLEGQLFAHYTSARDESDLDAATIEEFFPPLTDYRQLSSLIDCTGILVSYFDGDEWSAYIGLLMECLWDKEHGLGAKIVNGKVVEIGAQDIVI